MAFVPELDLKGLGFMTDHKLVPGGNAYGTPMAASTLVVNGKTLTYDDITYGYNRLWADLGLWQMQRWKGMRFFQSPMDAVAIQQLVWNVKPDLLIEIGTHGGGSAVFIADIMSSYS